MFPRRGSETVERAEFDQHRLIHGAQPPPVLYKYCDPGGIDILENLRLKVSPPNRFNDPFEFAPKLTATLSRSKVKRLIMPKDRLREVWSDLREKGRFQGSFRDFRRLTRERLSSLVDSYRESLSKKAAENKKDLVQSLSQRFAVFCLSEIRDDILMWSHYSRSHQGIVIGLATSHISLESDPNLLKVEYSSDRADMDYLERTRLSRQSKQQTDALIRRKSSHWSYEREWRRFYFVSECIIENDALRRCPNYFVPIEATTIREVILGCRATESTLSRIGEFQRDNRFQHVQFCHAAMHETDFALSISCLQPPCATSVDFSG